jgi:hypothetical protein
MLKVAAKMKMDTQRALQIAKLLLRISREFLMNPLRLMRIIGRAVLNGLNHTQHLRRLPNVAPLNFTTVSGLSSRPTLNVLIPGMSMQHMSGGPNTAINLAYRLAATGIPVRFISTDVPADQNHDLLWEHFASLTGITERLANVEICSGSDHSKPLEIGENDVFFGTAWWTVQMIKYALPLTKPKKFIYIIQEFEPGLYEFSSRYALALETYQMNFRGIINEQFLADYLCDYKIGRFADPAFIDSCAIFEPALDTRKFYPVQEKKVSRPKRLLFYARPNAPRNLFELGLNALQTAAAQNVFSGEEWELLFIGETLPDMKLGKNLVIRNAPWLNYDAYAELIRNSDIALSLMLSPHTSYPPLEMAACGGIAVTCSFAGKTQQLLQQISPNIIAVPPTVEGIVSGLQEAVGRVRAGQRSYELINMPTTWDEAFSQVVPKLVEMFHDCQNSTD